MSVCCCVLGMHGGGTSLVAGMLVAMSVQMNYNPKGQVKWYKNYEDASFMRLNEQILKAAGGNWRKPPEPHHIAALANKAHITNSIKQLVKRRQSKLWGFKDPRTSLTISLIHPHLTNPRYVRVTRSHRAIAQSILSRGPATREQSGWVALSKTYNQRLDQFFEETKRAKVLTVKFENLVGDKRKAKREVDRMVQFLGLNGKATPKAMGMIQSKKVRNPR